MSRTARLPAAVRPAAPRAALALALAVAALPGEARAGDAMTDGASARSLGLAGAAHGTTSGNDSIRGNPAALATFPRYALELGWAVQPRSDGQALDVSLVDSKTQFWGLGFAYTFVDTHDLLRTGDDELAYSALVHRLDVALSLPLIEQLLFFGVTGRWLRIEPRGGDREGVWQADAGVLLTPSESLTFGGVVQNFARNDRPETPLQFAVGASFGPPEMARLLLDVGIDPSSADRTRFAYRGAVEVLLAEIVPLRIGGGYRQERGAHLDGTVARADGTLPALSSGGHVNFGLGWIGPRLVLDGGFEQRLDIPSERLFMVTARVFLEE